MGLKELFAKGDVSGSQIDKTIDVKEVKDLPTIENVGYNERRISTTIDCYVTGQYIDNKGRVFTVKQRYSIQIIYSQSTYMQVLSELKQVILNEFENQYSPMFNVTDVFIPDVLQPKEPEAAELYRGQRLWKILTRIEKKNYELGLAKDIYKLRRRSIIKRYSIRRGNNEE